MWRYLAGSLGTLVLVGAGLFLWGSRPDSPSPLPAASAASGLSAQTAEDDAPLPEASAKTREQKRFDRYDKDRDGTITREEYLASRRKAYAKLDRDGDGKLSFDEWAIKATTKFATADRDKSGAMNAAEFATTAVKRRPAARANCPPAQRAQAEGPEAAPAEEN
ncbi:EF-hand domain-containing protein [Sphingomonas sp. GM_Shp_1]|uniref:EF-hand domain-containing protein n=1 Tax=Sphingomonas sp. GM_Shp_1 TaxID=2937381 RepID=UPI00226BAE66|nr:EF-hand domain-containing protein [Sphingomonas sp. GM_Shp_1]